jgi:hypothetical protein
MFTRRLFDAGITASAAAATSFDERISTHNVHSTSVGNKFTFELTFDGDAELIS